MNIKRRHVLQAALTPLIFPLLGSTAQAAPESEFSEIRIIQDKDPEQIQAVVASKDFAPTLARAVHNFLVDNYASGNVPVWKKPLSQIDFTSRLTAISQQVVLGILRHSAIYPVDPFWIMSQMLTESFFYEFAVSSALAVGPCQFIAPTARTYKMVCADEHVLLDDAVKHPELKQSFTKANSVREQMRTIRQNNSNLFTNTQTLLRTVLNRNAQGVVVNEAGAYLKILNQVEALQAEYNQERNNARQYLEENFNGRSIFNPQDKMFFEQFEQRVLYEYSINAMVKMMAENLKARGGNILAAAAGYNAGLGNTKAPFGVFTTYGRIPNFAETVDYVGKIVVIHHEILQRM